MPTQPLSLKISHLSAGVTAIFVGYSSAAVLILEAVNTLGGSQQMQASWLLAIGLAMGLSSIGLSLFYRMPILTAWSTPGVALLITALADATAPQAIGIFIFSSTLIMLSGFGQWVERLITWVPPAIAAALLGGILFQFVLDIVPAVKHSPFIVLTLLSMYFIGRIYAPRFVFIALLASAIVIPAISGQFDANQVALAKPAWVWIWPEFKIDLLIGVGLPLFIVTMVSQNIPGLFILRSQGYTPPAGPILTTTGIVGLIFAPLGAFAINLAAITAAICLSPEADNNPATRYKSTIIAGITYLLFALLGTTIVSVFSAMPGTIIKALAGIALFSVLASTMGKAFKEPHTQEAAAITFIVTAAGVPFWGISSAFWGLLCGIFLQHGLARLRQHTR